MRLTVTHQGVPVGLVDLDVDDRLGLGTLQPEAAYHEMVAPVLRYAAALGARARTELLILDPDTTPPRAELEEAATLSFELWDERGAFVPATVVRLVELTTRPGVTVLVGFGSTMSGMPAQHPLPRGDAPATQPRRDD